MSGPILPCCSFCSSYDLQEHAECSEAFYKKEIASDVKTAPKSKEEKQKMLDLLKRFEGDTLDDPLDEEDASNLADRLESLDIGKSILRNLTEFSLY